MKQQSQRNRKRWIWAIVAIVVIGLMAVVLRPKPEPADFGSVVRGALRVTIDEEGETRVRDRFVVSAPLAGRVLRIDLEPGDPVVANETVLATFQPSAPGLLDARSRAEAEARVNAAKAAVGKARADRDRAKAELKYAAGEEARFRRLADEEIVSKERLETAELELQTKEEALRAAEFGVRTAEYELQRARAGLLDAQGVGNQAGAGPIPIYSPVDAIVLRLLRESEAVVPAGEPLIEVGDPRDLEIVSDLLSTDAVQVRPDQRVFIEQWGGELPLEGRVRRVEPSGFTKISALGVEEQRVNVLIDLEDSQEAWTALGDGYRVEVKIVTWENEDVLKVPTSSLFRYEGEWAVFAVEAGQAVLRPIEVGKRSALEAEVLSGIGEGVQVIVHPGDRITDGVAVVERST